MEPSSTLYARASQLYQSGQLDRALPAYFELLRQDPTHQQALCDVAALLNEAHFTQAAARAYGEILKHYPGQAPIHVKLANILYKDRDMAGARSHYEEALRLDPDHAEAHQNLGAVLIEMGEGDLGWEHRRMGFQGHPVITRPHRGGRSPLPVLLLASARGGNIPFHQALDDRIFQVSTLATEFFDPSIPLPEHRLIWNVVGDADLCRETLDLASEVLKHSKAPVLNHPEAVLKTGRTENALRLGHLEGVCTPKTINASRQELAAEGAASHLQSQGFRFPLLLRAQGYHGGKHFAKLEGPADLGVVLAEFPGDEFIVIQFMPTASPDGKLRKYRAMIIGEHLYPLHLAVSTHWKIHYFSADMADNAGHRAEDKAFLEDMPAVLGEKAMLALERIRLALGLDYGGIDFGLTETGEVLVFEANATMGIYQPGLADIWAYRKAPVQTVLDAITALVQGRAAGAA
jgi:tetratricopeptide (TPR) repeat protein